MPNAARPHRAHAPVSPRLLRVRRQAGAAAGRSRRGPLCYLWASPNTLLGVALAALAAAGGRLRVVDGVLEAHGPAVRWLLRHVVPLRGGALAVTLGHVVVGRDASALDETRDHERAHVAQCERWGPCFLPAYLLSSAWALARGRHPYLDNAFEREAFAAERPGGRASAPAPRR